jgi:hypothetical protein
MWVQLVIMVVLMVAAYIFMPRPKMENAKRANLNDFTFPTNSNANAIPEVFGTVEIYGNCLWSGDLYARAIKQDGGSKGGSYISGYAYFLGLAYALCRKIDVFLHFKMNDTITASPMLTANGQFMAKTGENADVGGSGEGLSTIRVYLGAQSNPDPYLVTNAKSQIAYKNVAYMVMPRVFLGDNAKSAPYYSAIVKRTNLFDGWQFADINGDANPAHILYYILTKMTHFSADMLDTNSFLSAGHALYQEGLGISMVMGGEHPAQEWCEEILRTIDAVMPIDPQTGLIKLKLLRADYNTNTVSIVDESTAKNVNFERKSWEDTVSKITIKYTERATFKEASITGINTVAKMKIGYEKAQSIEYMGITNADNANKILTRLFSKLSYPLASVKFSVSVLNYPNLLVGDVIRFSNDALGIENLFIRVLSIGADKEDEQNIEIEAVEDIFSLGEMVISGNQPNEGIPTDTSIGEILYYDIKNAKQEMSMTRAVIPLVAFPAGFVQSVEVRDGLSGQAVEVSESLPAVLAANYNPLMTSALDLTDGFFITPLGNMWAVAGTNAGWQRLKYVAYIGDEQIAYQFRTLQSNGTYKCTNIIRGLNNTPVTAHFAGERVWFATVDANDLNVLPIVSPNPTIIFTPKNFALIGESVSKEHNYDYSVETPYQPANLKAIRNGNDITITWYPCKRLAGANYRNADNILCGEDENEYEGRWLINWNDGEAVVLEPKFTRTDAVKREYSIKSAVGAHMSAVAKITI